MRKRWKYLSLIRSRRQLNSEMRQKWLVPNCAVIFLKQSLDFYQTQVLDCQFHTRMVWSSEALRIQGYS